MTDSNGGELSAWDIMSMMDSGHAEEVVAVLSGVAEEEKAEERGFFEVVFTADELGLPAGGWVELEILGGGADFRGTAFAGADGRVRFARVPRQDVGATVSIALTLYDSEGHPVCSGNLSAVVEAGGTTEFKMPMVDLPAVPLVTFGSNGSKSGFSATKDGESYEVYEYTGSGLDVSIANQDPSLTMEVDLDGSHSEGDVSGHPLADGFHEITATVTKDPSLPPVTVTKRVYVVKKLTKEDIEFSNNSASILTNEVESGYKLLRYSYMADDVVYPTLSIENTYTGDSTTMDIGASSLSIQITGATSVTQTGDLSDRTLNPGDHTVTVTLSKPLCTPVKVTKKIRVKIKDVNVTVPSVHMIHNKNNETRVYVTIDIYIDAKNDGVDTTQQTMFSQTNWLASSGGWYYDGTQTMSNNTVTLTDPDSTFYFYTNHVADCGVEIYGYLPRGFDSATRKLKDLKGNRDFGKGSSPAIRVNSAGAACGASGQYSSYDFSVTLTEKTYTAGSYDD